MSSLTHNDNNVLARLSRRLPHLAHLLLDPNQLLLNTQLDSIDLVELLCAVESEFDVRLSDDDLESTLTIGQLAALIDDRT